MPKFLVTSGSYFQPFTYDELAKPIMQTVEAHNAAQDAYDALTLDTEALRQYIEREPNSPEAKALYDTYTQQLSSLQNNLWTRGYNAGTRRDLSAARTGYANSITRLASVIGQRQEDSKAHREAKIKNPDLVTSADPITQSLDDYLNNRANQNYFSYNGKEFEAGVATEIQAKAQSLLDSKVFKDPELIDQLTRITKYGVSEADRQAASPIVDVLLNADKETRDAYYKKNGTSVAQQMLVETLIGRYDAVGARNANISDSERGRLINYGKAGWAHASFKPEMKDFTDANYTEQAQIRKENRQHALNKALEEFKYNLEHPKPTTNPNAPYDFRSIVRTYDVPGKDYEKKSKEVTKRIDTATPTKLISKQGMEVTNHADASSLVYSEDERRKLYPYLGFDYGRNPTRGVAGIDSLTPSSRYLEGKVVDENGNEFFTRYEPYRKYVDPETGQTVEGAVVAWGKQGEEPRIDLDRSRVYHKARARYEERLAHYQQNEKDIAKLATIDPDRQYDYYDEDKLDFGEVPLSGYKDAVMAISDNSLKNKNSVYIGEGETDKGEHAKKLSAKLARSFAVTVPTGTNKQPVGEFTFDGVDYDWRDHKGNLTGFHYIDQHGDVSVDAVRNVNDVFNFNKDGEITNVRSAYVDREAVLGGYVIFETSKSKYPVTVPVSYLQDNGIALAFEQARTTIEGIEADPNASAAAKRYATLVAEDILCREIRAALGEGEITHSVTGSKKPGEE